MIAGAVPCGPDTGGGICERFRAGRGQSDNRQDGIQRAQGNWSPAGSCQDRETRSSSAETVFGVRL